MLCCVLIGVAATSRASTPDPDAKPKSREENAIDTLLSEPAPLPDWRAYLKRTRTMPVISSVPPAANAPQEEVVAYWRRAPKEATADIETQKRLLKVCEENPEELFRLLPRFSEESIEVYDRLKALTDRLAAEKSDRTASAAELVSTWLMNHERHGREDLIARTFPNGKTPDVVEPQTALDKLAKDDRENTRKLLFKKSADVDVYQRTAAICGLLQQFGKELTDKQRVRFQRELKQIGADVKAPRTARQIAIIRVMEAASADDEKWFLTLFGDSSVQGEGAPTLRSSSDGGWLLEFSTAPLAKVVAQRPNYWIPKIIPLVASKDPTTHAAAAYCLLQFERDKARADATRPLLPWLKDPNWAPDSERLRGRLTVINNLSHLDLPESIPALLDIIKTATGTELYSAASALEHYHVREAIAPLKSALARERDWDTRSLVLTDLLFLDGFTRPEKIEALESYAKKISTPAGLSEMKEAASAFPGFVPDSNLCLGQKLSEGFSVNDELINDSIATAKRLESSDRATADALRLVIASWHKPETTDFLIEQLRSGDFTGKWLSALKENPDVIAALQQVGDLHGASRGVQAALTANQELIHTILNGSDPHEQAALVAMARTKGTELPLDRVIGLLDLKDRLVARATDRYLEATDSATAREELWRRAPGQTRILGAKRQFDDEGYTKDDLGPTEMALRAMVLMADGPDELYALLGNSGFRRTHHILLLVYKDRILLRCEEYNGRTRERDLSTVEFRQLRDWLEREHVDDLPTLDEGSGGDVRQVEFLHLSRARGRRVFMIDPPDFRDYAFRSDASTDRSGPDATIYGELVHRMTGLDNAPTNVFYRSLSALPGFQLIHRREQQEVSSLRIKDNNIFAVTFSSSHEAGWHLLTDEGMSDESIPAPPENEETKALPRVPEGYLTDGIVTLATNGPFVGGKIWGGTRNRDGEQGLWSSDSSGHIELLMRGHYATPILSPDGQWLVADKFDRDGPNPWITIRMQVASRHVEQVNIPARRLVRVSPIKWIDSLGRVLVARMDSNPDVPWHLRSPQFLLLDPATGKFEETKLEFRPIAEGQWRSLQPTKLPDQYWAAVAEALPLIRTSVGRYDAKHFQFDPVVQLEGINLQSDQMAVDENHGFIWIITNGDVLRIALPISSDRTDAKASDTPSK
jgi:hypothetical protein